MSAPGRLGRARALAMAVCGALLLAWCAVTTGAGAPTADDADRGELSDHRRDAAQRDVQRDPEQQRACDPPARPKRATMPSPSVTEADSSRSAKAVP